MDKRHFDIAWADSLSWEWVKENVDFEAATANWDLAVCHTVSNTHGYRVRFEMPEAGTWRMNEEDGELEVLVWLRPTDATASERDWDHARRLPSTRQYTKWASQGHACPPVTVLQKAVNPNKETGVYPLSCMNRRRWLAAIDAEVDWWLAWHSPFCPEHRTRSRWFYPTVSLHYRNKIAWGRGIARRHKRPLTDYMDKAILRKMDVPFDEEGFEIAEEKMRCS